MRPIQISLAIAILVLQAIWIEHCAADTAEATTVQNDVRSMMEALYKGDVNALLAFTYPGLVTALGGEDAAKARLRAFLLQTNDLGVAVEAFSFPEAPTFLEGKMGRRFAVIPTRSIIVVKGQRIESESYLLGVKEPGSSRWTYVDGSRVTPDMLASLLPDFPSGYTLPLISRRQL